MNALITPRAVHGRVNAASTMFSSLLRALSVVADGVLTINGNPFPMFLLLALCFLSATLLAIRQATPPQEAV